MIKNFLHFQEVSVFGIDHFRDPATVITNIILFAIAIAAFLKLSKFKTDSNPEIKVLSSGWRLFFLFGAFAYVTGVPVHGFSWYIPEQTHFYIWIFMGWVQNLAVVFAQFATATVYFPKQLRWIKPLIIIQFVFFCGLMVYIRRFGAVNIDVAIALVPIACLHIYLFSKKRLATSMVGWGILFSALAGIAFVFKLMIGTWFSYIDIAHVILAGSLLLIYSGLVKNFRSASNS
ncbi:hypothetical protein BH09BAC5_BH09BAC5_01550 [soil metagenome]